MKISNLLLIISVILIFFMLSGCITTNENQKSNNDHFQLISYKVETWDEKDLEITKDNIVLGEGFLHFENATLYGITGIVKNKSEKNADILVNMTFYDKNNMILDIKSYIVYDVIPSNEKTFTVYYNQNDIDQFESVEKVSFELSKYD